MLSKENTELLCRVGAGTPMGELMRQYWLPAVYTWELEPDGDRILEAGEVRQVTAVQANGHGAEVS